MRPEDPQTAQEERHCRLLVWAMGVLLAALLVLGIGLGALREARSPGGPPVLQST